MAKNVKIKDIEGDVDAINTLFQQNSCDLATYIGAQKATPKKAGVYTIIFTFLFLIVASLVWIDVLPSPAGKVLIITLFAIPFIIAIFVQLIYRNWITTLLTIIGALAIILITLGVYTPQQVAQKLEETAGKQYNK